MTEDTKRLDAQGENIAKTRSGSRIPNEEKEYDCRCNQEQ